MNIEEQNKKLQEITKLREQLYQKVTELCKETEQKIEELRVII